MTKKLIAVFALAFALNLVWENFHSLLYIEYQKMPITELTLIKAALFDALFTAGLFILFFRTSFLRRRLWLVFVVGVVFAVCLELFALETGRWQYNSLMPVIPLFGVGLTPTIQLGFLGYFVLRICGVAKA